MTEADRSVDPRKSQAFKVLSEILANARAGDLQKSEVFTLSKSALQNIGYTPDECIQLLNLFIASEISSSMQGGFTELPDYHSLPEGWERKRLSSFAWWYASYVANENVAAYNPELKMYHVYMRAGFELGNSHKKTDDLLRWAGANPGRIASIFAEGIIGGELGVSHIPTLVDFVRKAREGTLVALNPPEENSNNPSG